MGSISAPVCLFFTGGFLGGNMLFCSLITGLTALCYSRKNRFIALALCLITNISSFFIVFFLGSPIPMSGVESFYNLLENYDSTVNEAFDVAVKSIGLDQLFTYTLSSLGLFLVLNWVLSDIKQFQQNQDTLTRYFDTEKRKEIFKNAESGNQQIVAEHRKAAILFADVSNFTSLSEKMRPELVSEFLNTFFNFASNRIHLTGGVIDKFIGDCIMAYWPDNDDDCVMKCVEAMLNLQKDILNTAEETYNKFGAELNFSAGISYGDVIFGDIGSETMHDYTIIGDAVNIASRIEGYATSGEIFISNNAAYKLKDHIILEKIESNHFFKGKNTPTDIYRVVGVAKDRQKNHVYLGDDFKYELHVCGCRGSFPVSGLRFSEYGGETSCYFIRRLNYACIIDCGTGLKNAVELLDGVEKVDILLTHVHYDHILGLLMSQFPENVEVNMYARFDKYGNTPEEFSNFMQKPYWPIKMKFANSKSINIGEEIQLSYGIRATFYESDHPDDACVINVLCDDKKISFLADCEDANKLDSSIAKNSELVFFDGMFDDNDKAKHRGWGHGTWQDAIRFLKGKNIKRLIVTHHSPECGDHDLMMKENEAREMAQNVSFAKSGDIYHF